MKTWYQKRKPEGSVNFLPGSNPEPRRDPWPELPQIIAQNCLLYSATPSSRPLRRGCLPSRRRRRPDRRAGRDRPSPHPRRRRRGDDPRDRPPGTGGGVIDEARSTTGRHARRRARIDSGSAGGPAGQASAGA
ncbi:hypothetical protein AC628_39405 [Bradyrhizobium sp. NAS96.2]|nr:hypothetical protein AC628_39405 [Bradyrhizobium sp. NAS96.2]